MEALGLGARLARSRLGETLVAVLGIALGVGSLSGVSTLIHGYDAYQARLRANPLSREIEVSGFRGRADSDLAVVPVDSTPQEPLRLSLADGARVMAEVEGLDSVYQYQSRRFSTQALARGGRFLQTLPAPPAEGGPAAPPTGAEAPGRARTPDSSSANASAPERAPAPETDSGPVDEVALETVSGMVVSPSFFASYGLGAAAGSLFGERDLASGAKVAVLGSALAKTLFRGADPIGKRLRLNGLAYDVIGSLEPDPWEDGTRQVPFDEMVFIPRESQSFLTAEGRTVAVAFGSDELSFMASAGANPARAGKQLQAWFDKAYGEDKVRVTTAAGRYTREVAQRKGILFVLTILAGAAAAAAAVNLFNIMAGRIVKRSRSYGIMRAVGATSREVFASILAEAGLAAAWGAVLSLVVSPLLFVSLEGALTAAAGRRLPVALDPLWLAVATLVSAALILALVAAPARAAARSPIAEALKSE